MLQTSHWEGRCGSWPLHLGLEPPGGSEAVSSPATESLPQPQLLGTHEVLGTGLGCRDTVESEIKLLASRSCPEWAQLTVEAPGFPGWGEWGGAARGSGGGRAEGWGPTETVQGPVENRGWSHSSVWHLNPLECGFPFCTPHPQMHCWGGGDMHMRWVPAAGPSTPGSGEGEPGVGWEGSWARGAEKAVPGTSGAVSPSSKTAL